MFSHLSIQSDVALQSLNTFGIAAQAQFFIEINRSNDLKLLVEDSQFNALPRLVLGGGSNLILTDDFPGIVLKMAISGLEIVANDDQFVYVQAGAGENWHDFVLWTLAQGWGGLENLSLIPGSVGAAPIQNIGAYGVELKDHFHSLRWFDFASRQERVMRKVECCFAYRDSIFKQDLRDKGAILSVTFALPKQWQPKLSYGDVADRLKDTEQITPSMISAAICAIRQSKLPDPKQIGNAGSFFKNPLVDAVCRNALLQKFPELVSYPQSDGRFKLAAGWLIERAGWKGKSVGAAGVYEKQALVLVNRGGASGREITKLARLIQEDVLRQFDVHLEVEPVIV